GVLYPGKLLKLGATQRQRHMEDVAANVAAKDREQLRPRDLAIAQYLNGRCGGDAEARVRHEEAVHANTGGDDERETAQHSADNQDAAKPPARQRSALDRDTTPCPQDRQFIVVLFERTRATVL